MKKSNKMLTNQEFTTHTLWTAPSSKSEDKKYEGKLTQAMQEQFEKSIARTEGEIRKKLESFESVEISDAVTRALVK